MLCQRLSFSYLQFLKTAQRQHLNQTHRLPHLQYLFRKYASQTKQMDKGVLQNFTPPKLAKVPKLNTTTIVQLILKHKYGIWIASGTLLLIAIKMVGLIGVMLIATPLLYINRNKLQLIRATFQRDSRLLRRYLQALTEFKQLERADLSLYDCFESVAKNNSNSVMVYYEDKTWTFKEMSDYVNKLAQCFQALGYDQADVIGIFVTNRPEFIALILAFSKLGAIGVPIDTNLKKNSLMRNINQIRCRGIVISQDLISSMQLLKPLLDEHKIQIMQLNGKPMENNVVTLETELKKFSVKELKMPYRVHSFDPLLYCFSVGPKGLPAVAVIPNHKLIFTAIATTYMLKLQKEEDKIYNILPLYNLENIMTGIGPSITNGIPIVLRKSFSAENYFRDCKKLKCTVAQYGSEICRVLINKPSSESDKTHSLRHVYGIGMHRNIAHRFRDRFNVHNMEFYGANEGTVNLVNLEMHDGASGYLLNCLPKWDQTLCLIRVRKGTLQPVRNAQGLCVLCENDEPGLLVGITALRPDAQFFGYNFSFGNVEKSKNMIYNVIRKGDAGFVTGDFFVKDKLGYLYFKERSGINFRWKSENICTELLEDEFVSITGVGQSLIYGVKIPNSTERAIMLAIQKSDDKLDITELQKYIENNLPHYCKPIFIRFVKDFQITNAKILDRERYVKEAYDLEQVKDELYYYNDDKNMYELLTPDIYKNIINNNVKT